MSNTQKDIELLLIDDSFVRWINGQASEKEERKWRYWLQQEPCRLELVKEAQYIYRTLKFEEEVPQTIGELNRLRNSIDRYESNKRHYPRLNKFYGRRKGSIKYWASAASVFMLLIATIVVIRTFEWDFSEKESMSPTYSTATTEYGQIRRLSLRDGSEVILNANSRLTYPEKYDGSDLEVHLEGEAYFSIVHNAGEESRTFTVQTPEGQVTVLGTKFNVNTRSDETEVVLEEGKIHLEVSDTLNAVKSIYNYTMKPGDKASLFPGGKGINVQTVDPSIFTAWRHLEFKFHDTPLVEIAERIRQDYGVEVEFRDERLKAIEFSGSVTNKNFIVLLRGLRTLLDIPITNKGDTIIFGR